MRNNAFQPDKLGFVCLAIFPDVYYYVYIEVYRRFTMRTNIVLNEELVKEAFLHSRTITTKRELVETALTEYVYNRKRKNIKELRGKIKFRENYDYKAMRK